MFHVHHTIYLVANAGRYPSIHYIRVSVDALFVMCTRLLPNDIIRHAYLPSKLTNDCSCEDVRISVTGDEKYLFEDLFDVVKWRWRQRWVSFGLISIDEVRFEV